MRGHKTFDEWVEIFENRKQEVLIQAVNDAKTVEEIEKICW